MNTTEPALEAPLPGPITYRSALLSPDGVYRYVLGRTWSATAEHAGSVTFVMLNPSTADADIDDPTIRRCIGFAKAWGYGQLVVVNLYALRSTDPAGLWQHPDPVGPVNDRHLTAALHARRGIVVAAWGVNAKPDRIARFFEIAGDREVHALRVTKAGAPGHPLYVPAAQQPQVYRPSVAA